MGNKYKWLLIIPVLMMMLGAYLLLSGEAYLKRTHTAYHATSPQPGKSQNSIEENKHPGDALGEDLKSNRDSAYPYFLLGTGLLVVLLVLPRLAELTFSPTSGFTLKVLQEAKAALEEAKTTTEAVEQKTKQALRAGASESLLAPRSDLGPELAKLDASTAKLNAYAALLEKMTEKKRAK